MNEEYVLLASLVLLYSGLSLVYGEVIRRLSIHLEIS